MRSREQDKLACLRPTFPGLNQFRKQRYLPAPTAEDCPMHCGKDAVRRTKAKFHNLVQMRI